MAQHKNIDIVPDETITRVHLSQGDIGRTLIFYLFENALSWSVPASSTIKCQGTKPSGFGFSVSCTYSGNAVTCVTTDEMTDEYGQIEAELVITSSDESQIFGTSNFILDIEKNPHPVSTEDGSAETAIALTARITALESAVGDIDDLETEADDLVGAINEIASGSGSSGEGLTDAIKLALLQLAQKVAYIDANGQDYYDDLYDALYAVTAITLSSNSLTINTIGGTSQLTATTTPAGATVTWASSDTSVATVDSTGLVTSVAYGSCTITATAGGLTASCSVLVSQVSLTSISATYTQSGSVYDTDSLSDLTSDLVVTATWSDSSTSTVSSNDYTLSGTLTSGTSTITVSYGGQTATFNVTVTAAPTLSSISAVYTQSGTVYDTDSLDSLKSDLVVTAHYSDSSTSTVASSAYTLSGTLTVGTSTVTVTYAGKTTTFTVTVTEATYVSDGLVMWLDGEYNGTDGAHNSTVSTWVDQSGNGWDWTANNTISANDKSVVFPSGNNRFERAKDSLPTNVAYVEVVLKHASFSANSVVILTGFGNNYIGNITFNTSTGIVVFHTGSGSGESYNTAYAWDNDTGVIHTFNSLGYYDGELVSSFETSAASWQYTYPSIGNYRGNAGHGTSYQFVGEIYAIRLYSRVLTSDEIARNHVLDVSRFGLGA